MIQVGFIGSVGGAALKGATGLGGLTSAIEFTGIISTLSNKNSSAGDKAWAVTDGASAVSTLLITMTYGSGVELLWELVMRDLSL